MIASSSELRFANPTVPDRLSCARCHKAGFVRRETVIRGIDTHHHYTCGVCGFEWLESEDTTKADRRRHGERRKSIRPERRTKDPS